MPRRAKTKPNFAEVDASRMSMGRVMLAPTPAAGPLIAAITGLVLEKIRSATRPPVSRCQAPALRWSKEEPPELTSAPAQKPAPGAGHHDHPYVVVGVGRVQDVEQIGHHPGVEGVQLLGPVRG